MFEYLVKLIKNHFPSKQDLNQSIKDKLLNFNPKCSYKPKFYKDESLEDNKFNILLSNNFNDENKFQFYFRVKFINLMQFLYDYYPANFNKMSFNKEYFIKTALNLNSFTPSFVRVNQDDMLEFTEESLSILKSIKTVVN